MEKNSENVGFFGGYRVAGIMVKDEKILLQTDEFYDFWTTPGGGIKMFEASDEALKREFKEELDVEINVERLLYIVENSFEFEGQLFHGLELYFLITPKGSDKFFDQEEFDGIENDFMPEKYGDEFKLTFRWFHPSEFDSIDIYPKILKEALQNIPDNPILFQNLEIRKEKK